MRAGAGYVTACVPASLEAEVATRGPVELMTRGLPDDDGVLTTAGLEAVVAASARGGALALGPGLGSAERARAFARELAQHAQVPLVIDADGLNAHASSGGGVQGKHSPLEELARRGAPTVLTPHAGELARLLDCSREDVERERLRHAREAARLARAVVVLKGDDSLVADPDGRVAVSPGASPALATAGTGDVLCGVIAALLAQGLDAFLAATAGVWLHVLAGREAARRQGSAESVIASDVVEALGAARTGERERAWRPGGRLAGG
jgi:NAD(P)H-hydrate epimerase